MTLRKRDSYLAMATVVSLRLVHTHRAPAGDSGVDWAGFRAVGTFGVT
jgi:hypothetical protein